MKKIDYIKILRWGLPILAILFVILCRYQPAWAEGYARIVYPSLSSALCAFSSIFPFSLEEVLVVVCVLWIILFPIVQRRKGKSWKYIGGRELEMLAWIYVWFYFGWGLNYFRYNIYTRLQTPPVKYEEQKFLDFLHAYTDSLNTTYIPNAELPVETIDKEVKDFYQNLPKEVGLVSPQNYQRPKFFTFTPLYSSVGVLGSMGPFFAEAQLNADLLPVQYPFTYAHEFAHLLGVSNEAEANYWAYRACIESANPYLRYSGYMGLFPYVLSNASSLLTKEQFQEWIQTIRPEVKEEYRQKNQYWRERYSDWLGQLQNWAYNLFLKGNNIPSGQKNYTEVIGILLSMESIK